MDPTINKLLNKSSNPLLNKIRSSLNKPVTRDVDVDRTNINSSNFDKVPNLKELINQKESESVYFSDDIDFSKEPTKEEYEKYKEFFTTSSDKYIDFKIKPENRAKLARRYAPFFKQEGIERSKTFTRQYVPSNYRFNGKVGFLKNNPFIQQYGEVSKYPSGPKPNVSYNDPTYPYRYEVDYNLGRMMQYGLDKVFTDERIDTLVSRVNKNLEFDTVINNNPTRYIESEAMIGMDQPPYVGTPDEDTPKKYRTIYSGRLGDLGQMRQVYSRFYPIDRKRQMADVFASVTGRERDEDAIYADSLNYDYEPRSFQNYNVLEMLNNAYRTPVGIRTIDGSGGTQAEYDPNTNRIFVDKYDGYTSLSRSGYYQTNPLLDTGDNFISQYSHQMDESDTSLMGLLVHEGGHATGYRGLLSTPHNPNRSPFAPAFRANTSYLTSLDAILGMTFKKETQTPGKDNYYHDIDMEYGAWSMQNIYQNLDKYEKGEIPTTTRQTDPSRGDNNDPLRTFFSNLFKNIKPEKIIK